MLTCRVGKNDIDTFSYEDTRLREWSNKGMLKCPICKEKMLYCHGNYKNPYFRHEKNSDCPDIYSEGVTQEHIEGIKILYNWLKDKKGITELQLEKWIEETHQRPDIYFKYNNEEYCIEYQCSPISTQYAKRHDLYRLQGINDIWILGTDKYDICKYNWINEIQGNNIEIKEIKTKTIERELLLQNENIYYLKDNNLVYTYSIDAVLNLKTIFNFNICCKNISNINICDFLNNKIPCNELKYNNLFNTYKNLSVDLNNYCKNHKMGENYSFKILVSYNNITFQLSRNGKVIFNNDYYNFKLVELYENFNNEIDLINEQYKNILKREIEFKKIEEEIKRKNKRKLEFKNKLENEIIKINNDDEYCIYMSLELYKDTIQIRLGTYIFVIDSNKENLFLGKWETHNKFDGISRRGRVKTTTGWHLKTIHIFDICNYNYLGVIAFIKHYVQDKIILRTKDKENFEAIQKEKEHKRECDTNIIKESFYTDEINKFYDNIEVYYNGFGNIVIRLYSDKYGNRCYRLPEEEFDNMDKINEYKNDSIEKINIMNKKDMKRVEKQKCLEKVNKYIKNKFTDVRLSFDDGVNLKFKNKSIKQIMSINSFNRRTEDSIYNYLKQYSDKDLLKDFYEYIKYKANEIRNELINNNYHYEDIYKLSNTKIYKFIKNDDIHSIKKGLKEKPTYRDYDLENFINNISRFYSKNYYICKTTILYKNEKNCVSMSINKLNINICIYIVKKKDKYYIPTINKSITTEKELKMIIENIIRSNLYKQ